MRAAGTGQGDAGSAGSLGSAMTTKHVLEGPTSKMTCVMPEVRNYL